MPAIVEFHNDHCIINYCGCVHINESIKAYGEIVGDPGFDQINYMIADCRKLTEVNYDEKDYRMHASFCKSSSTFHRKRLKVAAIVSNEQGEQAVKMLISELKKDENNWERKIFWDYENAMKWIEEDA